MYENYFIVLKTAKNLDKAKKDKENILKNIFIKNIVFFSINLILLLFFGFYLICFNALFKNTQIYLIINTCISFIISMMYPCVICIIPSLIRKDSLTLPKTKNNKNNNNNKKRNSKNINGINIPNNLADYYDREYSYNVSQLLYWL